MELLKYRIPKDTKKLVIAPLGDFQWNGDKGPTAQDSLKRHIDYCLEQDAYYIGVGDYIDFLSPSGRKKLMSADLYECSQAAIVDKAMALNQEVYEKFLMPTRGRWLGLVEGHHFFEWAGETTDQHLAALLKTTFLGTSAYINIPVADITLYTHHGLGGGILPGTGINRLYHIANGLPRADFYLMGHNTKMGTVRLSRPYPVWGKKPSEHHLAHGDLWLVNCGGFSRSNIENHRVNGIPRGDYAERGMMTPSPLAAPLITIDLENNRKWVAV